MGLPAVVSRELRALAKVDNLSLLSVIERARALMAEQVVEDLVAMSAREEAEVGCSAGCGDSRLWRCCRRGRPHQATNCTAARKMNCWTCGLEGHFARDSHSDSGNEVGKTGALAVFPELSQGAASSDCNFQWLARASTPQHWVFKINNSTPTEQ